MFENRNAFSKARPVRLLAGILGAAALTGCGDLSASLPGGQDAGPPTTLLVGFHKAETFRYKFSDELKGELIGNNKDVNEVTDVSGIETINVVGVQKNGALVLDVLLEQAKGTENGKPFKIPEVGKHFQLVIGTDGEIQNGDEINSQSTNTTASDQLPGTDQWTPLTPGNKKVQVGDTWDTSYDRPFTDGDGMIHEDDHSQFVRWEAVQKEQTAVIQTNYSVDNLNVSLSFRKLFAKCGCQLPPDINPRVVFTGKLSGVETDWVDTKHNEVLKSESTGFFDVNFGLRDFPPDMESNGDYSYSGSDNLKVESLKVSGPGTIL